MRMESPLNQRLKWSPPDVVYTPIDVTSAQQRSTYGERTLEAIARRFEISIRHAHKYSLVWKVFFSRNGEAESVNVDQILLDEPSWYVVAATEIQEPERWLAYAQDRKMEDSRYSVSAFRRDILVARITAGVMDSKEAMEVDSDLPRLDGWKCPWVKLFCVHSGSPTPYRSRPVKWCKSPRFPT